MVDAGIEAKFKIAADEIKANKDTILKLPKEQNKDIYGFFKQATCGDINIDKPQGAEGEMKWDVWNSKKGISKEDAMKAYMELATKVLPADSAAKFA